MIPGVTGGNGVTGVVGVGGSAAASWLELESTVSSEDDLSFLTFCCSFGGVRPSWETWTSKLEEVDGGELPVTEDEVA